MRALGQWTKGWRAGAEEGVGGLRGMTDEEEAGARSLSSPVLPLLPLLLIEDKSLWAVCRNTSPRREKRGS